MLRHLPRLLLALLLANPLSPAGTGIVVRAAMGVAVSLAGTRVALAQRSSGGYSRPSTGGSSSYSRPSTSTYSGSSSGGYAAPRRPSTQPSYAPAPSYGSDQAISRQSSGNALQQYRAAQTPPPEPARRPPPLGNDTWSQPADRRPAPSTWGQPQQARPQYAQPQYAPQYAQAPPNYGWAQPGRSFGVWDGLMLWTLLNSLNSPGRANFFHDNQDTPGYRQWRAETEHTADQDPAVRAKLAELDKQLAQLQGQPRQPGSAPPPLAPAPAQAGSGGGSMVFIILFLLVALFVVMWWWRRHAAQNPAAPGVPAALKGSAATRFRVGMTIPVDPSPFVLAAGITKVKPLDGSGMISVERIGVLMDGDIPINRLYLPGGDSFFQLHLGTDGKIDECRYFSKLDEVTPASQEEWGAWLDPAQGMIGYPQFQTKDGKTYARAWAPGDTRIEPRAMTETVQDLRGTTTHKLMAMLYAGATGAAAPAPEAEYIMVNAIDDSGRAWVEIHAGIDINPATLTLPSVALS